MLSAVTISVRRLPVLAPEAVNTTEVVEVSGYDDKATTSRVTGYQDVIGTDKHALALKVGIDVTGMGCRIFVE